MSSAITAISCTSDIIAVHSPSRTSIQPSDSKQRLVVKLYDAKVSLGSLKFSLATHRTPSSPSSPLAISQLFFCGSEDEFLIATLDGGTTTNDVSKPIVVWDLKRGAVKHDIPLPPNASLLAATAGHTRRRLYLLLQNTQDSKLVVYVHDLDSDKARLLAKVKIGSCDSDELEKGGAAALFGMALCEPRGLIAVRYGKRIKISPLSKGADDQVVRCRIKASALSHASVAGGDHVSLDNMVFSSDGKMLVLAHSSGLLFYSAEDGKKVASAPLIASASSSSSTHLQVHADTPLHDKHVLLAVTNRPAGRATLYCVDPADHLNDNNIHHFATLTSPPPTDNAASAAAQEPATKILQQVYLPRGKRGRNTLLLLELSPTSVHGDADVHLSELPYRTATVDNNTDDGTASSLLQGELYPTDQSADTNPAATAADTAPANKKRKIGNVALGPGEAGGEAMNVSDSRSLLLRTKKQKKIAGSASNDAEDKNSGEFDFLNLDDEQDGNKEANDGTTIAERLALLSSELDRDTDDEDDHKTHPHKSSSQHSKPPTLPITSGSLLTLLRQSLTSNNDSQLEVALQVSDRKMIQNSIEALCAESVREEFSGGNLVMTLLSKLTTRLSRKAGRAERLGYWVSATLIALIAPCDATASHSWNVGGGRGNSALLEMGTTQMEIAAHLGPLRNMLNERVESLPSLLKLEGRLGLLGKLS